MRQREPHCSELQQAGSFRIEDAARDVDVGDRVAVEEDFSAPRNRTGRTVTGDASRQPSEQSDFGIPLGMAEAIRLWIGLSMRLRTEASAALGGLLEVGQFAEELETGIDLFAGQRLEALGAETLDGERSHDPSIEQSALQYFAIQFLLRGDVAHESAGERISRTGWILHFFDGQRGRAEGMTADAERPFAEENCGAIFSVLDDQSLRAHGENFLRGAREIGLVSEHLGFGVVDEQARPRASVFRQVLSACH